jgi:hypothetical protein
MNAAEEVDHVVIDSGVVGGGNTAEEVYDVVVRCAVDIDVSKENDDVSRNISFNRRVAEEADGIANGSAGKHIYVFEEMDFVLIGASGCSSGRKKCGEQETREHGWNSGHHANYTRRLARRFP